VKALTLQQLVNIWRNSVKQVAQYLPGVCNCDVIHVEVLTLQQLVNVWRNSVKQVAQFCMVCVIVMSSMWTRSHCSSWWTFGEYVIQLAQRLHAVCDRNVVQVKALTLQQLVNIWRIYVKRIAQSLHGGGDESAAGEPQALADAQRLAGEACALHMRVALCNPFMIKEFVACKMEDTAGPDAENRELWLEVSFLLYLCLHT
jgi:hypothetical protein